MQIIEDYYNHNNNNNKTDKYYYYYILTTTSIIEYIVYEPRSRYSRFSVSSNSASDTA